MKTASSAHCMILLSTVLISATNAVANEPAEIDTALADLFSALQTETDIATKTKMNVDFVPGMVSVLRGADLRAKGVRYLHEALELIPGIEVSISGEGQHSYIFRGIGKSFSSGKTKMLLNNAPMNAAMSASSTLSAIPIENVDRIEVVRGPSSAVYGEYAFTGMINIITRQDTSITSTYTHNGSWRITGSASKHYGLNNRISIAAGQNNIPGGNLNSGNDYLAELATETGFPFQSNSPGTVNDISQESGITLDWQHGNARLVAQDSEHNSGDYFGFNNALPGTLEIMRTVHTSNVNLEYARELLSNLKGKLGIGWRSYSLLSKNHLFMPANQPGLGNSVDLTGSPNYKEQEYRASGELTFTGLTNHTLLTGGQVSWVKQGETWATRNFIVSGSSISEDPLGLVRHTGAGNWLTEDNNRYSIAGYVQDEFTLNEKTTLTAGVRGDYYHRIGYTFNPRIAGVYQIKTNHVLKAQYATAFRPPTFVELYARNNPIVTGNPDIQPESTHVAEGSYIYNNGIQLFRGLAYVGHLQNLIVNDEASGLYQNIGSVKTLGMEIEASRAFGSRFLLGSNASYHWSKDNSTGKALPMISKILGNLEATYKPITNFSTYLHVRYMGPKQREIGDSRSDLKEQYMSNAALSYSSKRVQGLRTVIAIKNILNQKVIQPAPLTSFGAYTRPAYKNDFPILGRELLVTIEYIH